MDDKIKALNKPDLIEQKVWSTKQLAFGIAFAISVTFSGTVIWTRFLFTENQILVVDAKHTESNRVLSDRLEKKTKRIEEDNLKQWEMINKLLEDYGK